MKKSIVRTYLLSCLSFGLAMGLFFPVFAAFFVTFLSPAHLLWFCVCCVAAGLAVGWFSFAIGSATLLKVVRRVGRRLDDLASRDGDLTARIDVESHDAVGDMVTGFHAFQDRLRGLIGSLAHITEQTRAGGEELSANAVETSAAASQIQKNTEATLAGTRELQIKLSAVDHSKAAILETARTSFEAVNRQSMSVLTLSSLRESNLSETLKVSAEAQHEAEGVTRTLQGARLTLSGMKEIAAQTRSIHQDGQTIRELVQGIEDVAEQITVLGVNAAIEAARAGASGRGFTVVADQVRKLAEVSKANAGRVATTLGTIQIKVENASQVSTRSEGELETLLQVIDGLAEATQSLKQVLDDHADHSRVMLAALQDLEQVTSQVSGGTNRLVGETDAIDRAIQEARSHAEANLRALEEIAVGIGQIALEAHSLQKVSQANAESASVLSREVGRFTI